MRASGRCVVEVDGDAAARLSALLAGTLPDAPPAGPDTPELPIIYGMRLMADAARLAGRQMESAGDGLWLHEAQSIVCARPPRAGERLAASLDATAKGTEATLSLAVTDEYGAVMELTTRLRKDAAALLATARASGRQAGAPPAGAGSLLSAPLSGAVVEAYAALSGDSNPLHLDSGLVESLGFPERIVHGMLLAGMAEPALRAAGIGRPMTQLRVRFLAPAHVGERVRVWLAGPPQPAGDGDRARVVVAIDGGPIACIADTWTAA